MQELNHIIMRNIKKERKKRKISQEKMGEIIGVNQSQYAKYEKGIQSMTVAQLCQLLKWLELDFNKIGEV